MVLCQNLKRHSERCLSRRPYSRLTGPGAKGTQIDRRISDVYGLARRELSVASTTKQGPPLFSGTPENIREQNAAEGEELLWCWSSSSMSTSVTRQRNNSSEQVNGPTLDELRTLARWLCLRDQALPPPTVGGVEPDPSGVAERYGVRGMSVLTAFVDMENLSCRVCSFKAKTASTAVLHQQQRRHFQT